MQKNIEFLNNDLRKTKKKELLTINDNFLFNDWENQACDREKESWEKFRELKSRDEKNYPTVSKSFLISYQNRLSVIILSTSKKLHLDRLCYIIHLIVLN